MIPIYKTMYLDGEFVDTNREISDEGSATYDVLRVVGGIPLFYKAHEDRVNNSLQRLGYEPRKDMGAVLQQLIERNELPRVDANVKILAGGNHGLVMAFVPSRYPSPTQYEQGVRLCTYEMERSNPEDKVWHEDYKQSIAGLMHEKDVFEVLLVNAQKLVTEGSQSNVFFIQDRDIITPATQVLPGITRHYAEMAMKEAGLTVSKRKIGVAELSDFDAAFLTGTSLHILPIQSIEGHLYDAQNEVLRQCMQSFSKRVEADLRAYKDQL